MYKLSKKSSFKFVPFYTGCDAFLATFVCIRQRKIWPLESWDTYKHWSPHFQSVTDSHPSYAKAYLCNLHNSIKIVRAASQINLVNIITKVGLLYYIRSWAFNSVSNLFVNQSLLVEESRGSYFYWFTIKFLHLIVWSAKKIFLQNLDINPIKTLWVIEKKKMFDMLCDKAQIKINFKSC